MKMFKKIMKQLEKTDVEVWGYVMLGGMRNPF